MEFTELMLCIIVMSNRSTHLVLHFLYLVSACFLLGATCNNNYFLTIPSFKLKLLKELYKKD